MYTIVFNEVVDGFRFKLTTGGHLYVAFGSGPEVKRRWYQNPVSRAPWIPKKVNFVALMAVRVRMGEFNDLKSNPGLLSQGLVPS
jgi:hypothetical protein